MTEDLAQPLPAPLKGRGWGWGKKKTERKKEMKKKTYQTPAMQVINIEQHQILCGSPGAKSLGSSGDGIGWDDDGIDGDDY